MDFLLVTGTVADSVSIMADLSAPAQCRNILWKSHDRGSEA